MKKFIEVIRIKVAQHLDKRRFEKEARNTYIKEAVQPQLKCKDIAYMPAIFLGQLGGYYKDGRIVVNESKMQGLLLADTLYHEDRHHQQHMAGVSCEGYGLPQEIGIRAYRAQHIEKDARRYAYVKVCRNFSKDKKIGLYKFFFHPWKGLVHKLVWLDELLQKRVNH